MGYLGNQITTIFPTSISVDSATISGNTTVGGTLGVTGATTLSNTLGVTGVSTLSDNIVFGASGKGVHLGVTSSTSSNLVDDYEEGSGFADIEDGNGNSYTFYEQDGQYNRLVYTKIGRLVFFTCRFYTSSTGSVVSSAGARITGLPFTAISSVPAGAGSIHNAYVAMNTSSAVVFSGMIQEGTTYMSLHKQDDDGDFSNLTMSELGGCRIEVNGMYHTA